MFQIVPRASDGPNLNLPVFNSFAPTANILAEISGRDLLFKTVQGTESKFRLGRRLLCAVKSVSDWGTGLVLVFPGLVVRGANRRVLSFLFLQSYLSQSFPNCFAEVNPPKVKTHG